MATLLGLRLELSRSVITGDNQLFRSYVNIVSRGVGKIGHERSCLGSRQFVVGPMGLPGKRSGYTLRGLQSDRTARLPESL